MSAGDHGIGIGLLGSRRGGDGKSRRSGLLFCAAIVMVVTILGGCSSGSTSTSGRPSRGFEPAGGQSTKIETDISAVDCSPTAPNGQYVYDCTVTIVNVGGEGPTPTGEVNFYKPDYEWHPESCTLGETATCSSHLTVGPGDVRVSLQYLGDDSHASSNVNTLLNLPALVTEHPCTSTPTGFNCP
jgi:hypothetical protein